MRKKRVIYLFGVILTALGLLSGLKLTAANTVAVNARETAVSSSPSLLSTSIQPIKSDATGLRFTLQTPRLTITKEGAVQVAGLTAQTQEPGAPALPYYVTFIALPPEAAASIHVQLSDITTSQAAVVLPVPRPVSAADDGGKWGLETAVSPPSSFPNTHPPALVNAPDPAIYGQNTLYPNAIYTLSEPMYIRDLRLVELRLYPVRYNPVTRELQQAQQLNVTLQFEGAQLAARQPAATTNTSYLRALSDAILNYDQLLNWRSLPQELINTPAANFPTNAAETYKIEVNQDGIYEISGADLIAAGMNITNVNPATLEMMVRGQPVAYQFVGDNDAIFESNEAVRFYGWAFDGPRTEKQFISNNVFWLWADGNPTRIVTATNQTGGAVVTSTLTAVTREPENIFTSAYSDQWDTFPNEPDSWYWDYIKQGDVSSSPTQTYQITLPHPITAGGNATYTIELLSREKSVDLTGITYSVRGYVNNNSSYGEATWTQERDINITNTVPQTDLRPQANDVHLVFNSSSSLAEILLNRITITYTRQLIADNDQLIFTNAIGGSREFRISGFANSNPAKTLVWNTTILTTPVQIEMAAGHINGSGSYTYTVGSAGSNFIATTITNTLAAANISQYTPANLTPPGGGADWVAISHADFITAANRLAAHRADFSGLQTWVVDYEDVINQYGYGLALPSAIRDYLAYAQGSWSPAPGYATLFGSATLNPRNLDCQHATCPGGLGVWDKDQPTYVVTDLVYKDRFQGLIPSDHTMALLSGNDLLPDIALGRITADTAAQAGAAVSKIILYEQNQMTGDLWQQNLLFVADNADQGGNFYVENLGTAASLPSRFTATQRYLVTDSVTETTELRNAMNGDINGDGVSIINYRGHGSVNVWASPSILSSDNTDFWTNASKPTVILSADCLDGNFAFPGLTALSKTFLTLQSGATPVGTAAHWSSTGLGYTSEHSVLHRSFYSGLFDQNLLTIGDAVNYAKEIYYQGGYHDSEMYSFLLQGDPAMQMFTMRRQNYLPAILNQ